MLSLQHAALVEMFRNFPELIPQLLTRLGVAVPSYETLVVSEATLDEVTPTEFRADLVVDFKDEASGRAKLSAVLEVQLRPDEDKYFVWPSYLVLHRARRRCDTCVLVLAPDPAVAAWASRPIRIGPGNELRVLVIGPAQIPVITDRAEAAACPPLTVLSALAHVNEPEHGVPLLRLALGALNTFDKHEGRIYLHLIYKALDRPLRAAMRNEMSLREHFSIEDLELPGFVYDMEARGEARGEARTLLKILELRGIPLTPEQHERIAGCTDAAQLDAWVARTLTARTADELFG